MKIKNSSILLVGLMTVLCAVGIAQTSKPMTNQDVIKLVQAKLSEDAISMAIRASKPGFDTSTNGLVKLSSAGVPDSIIKLVIELESGVGTTSPSRTSTTAPASSINPEEVILIDGGNRNSMRYLTPQMRMAARAMGFGGVATYAALSGTRATLRLQNHQPSFMVAVPSNAQPESYFTIANFAVRKNGTREVLVGGGYMSYSSGVNKDRVVATTTEKEADQSKAPKGFILYRVNLRAPLAPGEYAFILYNSQVKVTGYFLGGADSYFDFGVDT
jgi:hypothetical protein